MGLKIHWPFRPDPFAKLGSYFFGDQLYSTPAIDYGAIGENISRYDIILRELLSQFDSAKALHRAEDLLDGLMDKLASNVSRR